MKANKFLKVCQKCKAACCKLGGPTFTEKEMRGVLKSHHKNYFYKVGKGFYEVKCKKGVCPYLKKDNSCEIHKIKPLLCLCHPVFPEFNKNKKVYIIIECPMAKILSKKEIEKCRREASKVSKKLMKAALDFSTLPKSDIKLVEKRFKKFKIKKLK